MLIESVIAEDISSQALITTTTPGGPKASEICLFCNLYDLFTKYSINEMQAATPGNSEDDIDRVL